jgi:hypothetical protein
MGIYWMLELFICNKRNSSWQLNLADVRLSEMAQMFARFCGGSHCFTSNLAVYKPDKDKAPSSVILGCSFLGITTAPKTSLSP